VHAHPDPRRLLAAAAAALALMLGALVLPAATADLDLRLGGGGAPSAGDAGPALVARQAPAQPRWSTDPLSPPRFAAR
jgi:hypothetical protein